MQKPSKVRVGSEWSDSDREDLKEVMHEYHLVLKVREQELRQVGLMEGNEKYREVFDELLRVQNLIGSVIIHPVEILEAYRGAFADFLLDDQ